MTNAHYRISIAALDGESENPAQIYEQVVEALNIRAVIEAVNADAPLQILPIRRRATRSDKGKPKKAPPAVATE